MKKALCLAALTLSALPLFAQSPEAAPSRQPAPPSARRDTTPAPDGEERGDRPEITRSGDDAKSGRPSADAKDKISTTQHTVTIGGQTISYTAHAGTMIMKDEEGKPRASFFFTSYTKNGADPARRPVTYTFNGGPGSSSVWLHMGAFGPKRVVYADDMGNAARPPYRTVDNEGSILDVTDLVFIDPVTTGYSRAIPFADANKFHGVDSDIQSVGEFIRLWTTRYGRWSSPKFLAGESYGTTRAAGLSGWLAQQGFYLNGIVLISSILNFETASFDSGNDLAYELFLPTYTAIAWYHKRLPADLQNGTLEHAVAESEEFALGEYTHALMQSDRISDQERRDVAEKLARLTGLSPEYIDRANLRVRIDRFDKELLRNQRRVAGRLDGRFTGIDRDAAGESTEQDPSYSAIFGEYTAVVNDYVRRELKFDTDLPYEILTGKVRPWSYDRASNRYVDVAETLRGAIAQNPYMKVFVANGYYDLATPFAATRYTFARMQLDPDLRKNISMDYFETGHMVYIDRKAQARLKKDVDEFIRANANVQ
ncbi:MAG TPA: peptidase S10 [Thermoanaerobaculia bacterium]|jgi:carboxypeptidase C (cathepsin A)|nr:peptidase S10 [Thermoanaerobaculia bacterium]